MIDVGLRDVEFIACNTDSQSLINCQADVKVVLGPELLRGLGAGGDPEKGRKAAEESAHEIEEALRGADMVFIATGEGGGTGTGASPVVARIARSLPASGIEGLEPVLTVGVVTRPFTVEGIRKTEQANEGIEKLRAEVDSLITIPNDRLLELNDRSVTLKAAFHQANQVLLNGVQGITDLITNPGFINRDFNDVRSVMGNGGTAIMGIGEARGEDRAMKAAEAAMTAPLFELSVDGALSVLVNVEGPEDLGIHEYGDVIKLIGESAHKGAHVIVGTSIDETLGDQVRVSVIATFGQGNTPEQVKSPALSASYPQGSIGQATGTVPIPNRGAPGSIPPAYSGFSSNPIPANPRPLPVNPVSTGHSSPLSGTIPGGYTASSSPTPVSTGSYPSSSVSSASIPDLRPVPLDTEPSWPEVPARSGDVPAVAEEPAIPTRIEQPQITADDLLDIPAFLKH